MFSYSLFIRPTQHITTGIFLEWQGRRALGQKVNRGGFSTHSPPFAAEAVELISHPPQSYMGKLMPVGVFPTVGRYQHRQGLAY